MKRLLVISLSVAVCLGAAVISGVSQTAYRISAPYTHKNLTIFLIHGEDASKNKDLITLQEALEMKVFKVYETEDVNELMVENISPKYDVFIQSGDIVKGGKQDRVLAISVIIPRNSGKVSIEAFCVESGRWEGRGNESRKEFSSSEERVVSKELKVATNGSQSQQEVWTEVANAQQNISANMTVDVTANASRSSLQLSLENKKLAKAREDYVKKLSGVATGTKDVIGYAFAINGKINSADIYVSNHLFAKLWPKMLKAAVVEAISLADRPKAEKEPSVADVAAFLAEAEKGEVKERPTVAKSKVITRQAANEVVYEARDRSDQVVHRNYVKLN